MQLKYLKENFFSILIGLYPAALAAGTAISETINLILIISFLYKSYSSRNWKWIKNKTFIFLIIIWFYLIINWLLSNFPDHSFDRAITFIRFPILIFSLIFFFSEKENSKKIIFNMWFYILAFLICDLLFEAIMGYNLVGYKSPWPERLSGMMFGELKIAHLLIGFTLPILFVKFHNDKNFFKFLLYIIIYITVLILTGERSNSIKGVLIVIFSFIFCYKIFIKKILYVFLIIPLFFILIYLKPNLHQRYFLEISYAWKNNNSSIIKLIEKSNYGPHYLTAIEIFKNYPMFGSGIQTFRIECQKKEYSKLNGCTTHPHQIFLELLSELGLIGFFLIITFIFYVSYLATIIYKKNHNGAVIASTLFILGASLPLIPGGSFFTSFGATIFWINIAMIIKEQKK